MGLGVFDEYSVQLVQMELGVFDEYSVQLVQMELGVFDEIVCSWYRWEC